MVPGLPPFGGPHCRPRIPLQPAGQPIFPHGSIDQVMTRTRYGYQHMA